MLDSEVVHIRPPLDSSMEHSITGGVCPADEGMWLNLPLYRIDREIFAVINFRRYCITTKIKNTKYFQRRIIYDSI